MARRKKTPEVSAVELMIEVGKATAAAGALLVQDDEKYTHLSGEELAELLRRLAAGEQDV